MGAEEVDGASVELDGRGLELRCEPGLPGLAGGGRAGVDDVTALLHGVYEASGELAAPTHQHERGGEGSRGQVGGDHDHQR